jgi:hypothetical protein
MGINKKKKKKMTEGEPQRKKRKCDKSILGKYTVDIQVVGHNLNIKDDGCEPVDECKHRSDLGQICRKTLPWCLSLDMSKVRSLTLHPDDLSINWMFDDGVKDDFVLSRKAYKALVNGWDDILGEQKKYFVALEAEKEKKKQYEEEDEE